jgi:hypothetical protein
MKCLEEKKFFFLFILLILFARPFVICAKIDPPADDNKNSNLKIIGTGSAAKEFVRIKGFNRSLCFLLDLSAHSGKNRFFVFDLRKDSVLYSGLVTHGSCNSLFQHSARFSNEQGCGCSSYGKYKVSGKYSGRFGTAYKLVGLDSSNSNVYERAIVLHSHSCVPDTESYPDPICNSQGCPTVSLVFLKKLSGVIDTAKKPILLWVFQ